MFITFEGGEGAGKSTQALILADLLKQHGVEVLITREPGGSPGAEIIRNLLVTGSIDRWSTISEALLIYAARADHWLKTIKPALDAGAWVLSDRFADSTVAYQGYGKGISIDFLHLLYKHVIGNIEPDFTFLLDLDVNIGLKRAQVRMKGNTVVEGRFEAMEMAFHERVRSGFLKIAMDNQKRFSVIDANGVPSEIHQKILTVLQERGVLPWNNHLV